MTSNNRIKHKDFFIELELEKEIWLMEFIESKNIEKTFQERKNYLLERHQKKLEITQQSYQEFMEKIRTQVRTMSQEDSEKFLRELENAILLRKKKDGTDIESEKEKISRQISTLKEVKEKSIIIKRKIYIKKIFIKIIMLLILIFISYFYFNKTINIKEYIAIILNIFLFYEIHRAINIRAKIRYKHQLTKKQTELTEKKFEELLQL